MSRFTLTALTRNIHTGVLVRPFPHRTCVVTGASSGVGQGILDALLAQGVRCAALSRNPQTEHKDASTGTAQK